MKKKKIEEKLSFVMGARGPACCSVAIWVTPEDVSTRAVFGYRWAALGLKPWPYLEPTPNFISPIRQRTKCTPYCLKVVYWRLLYVAVIVFICILEVYKKWISRKKSNQSCMPYSVTYSRPKRSDFYTPSQTKLLKNHALYRGTYSYSGFRTDKILGVGEPLRLFHVMGFSETLWRDSQYLFLWWRKRKSRKNYHLWWEPGDLHAVLSLFG